MADPKQRSLELPPTLTRILPAWISPLWTAAERWRAVVRNQPVSIICRDKLITHIQAMQWDIRARKTEEQSDLEDDVRYYKEFVLKDFDSLTDLMLQDGLDLPIGGSCEVLRFDPNVLPSIDIDGETYKVTRPWAKGHVFNVIHIDGATLIPTYDKMFPLMQRIPQDASRTVFFTENEIGRILFTPRPELQMKGFGMPPPQRVYLALTLLFRGDQYYANLLLDTPDAGVLDLMDVSAKGARDWVASYKTLAEGIDAFKIGVLYEHEKPANFISFGRPPSEMTFDATTTKYARINAAGYWLTLADIGLEPDGGTLNGNIRRQREARRSGFGLVEEKIRTFVNGKVLPPWLEFAWIDRDEEALTAMGRSRLLNGQAIKSYIESGVITKDEGQAQLEKDGLITVEVIKPSERPVPEPVAPPMLNGGNGGFPQIDSGADRVPAEEGGRGDATVERAAPAGDPSISAAPRSSIYFDQMKNVFQGAFGGIVAQMGEPQLAKLIRAATRLKFDAAKDAIVQLSDTDLAIWTEQKIASYFGEPSIIDQLPDVQKQDDEVFEELSKILDDDRWWSLPEDVQDSIIGVLVQAFSEGATVSAAEVQRILYEEGVVPSPDLVGFNFSLTNPHTVKKLRESGANMVRSIDDGTKTFIRRIIVGGVEEGLSSQEIAARIKEGAGVNTILRETGFIAGVGNIVRGAISAMFDGRVDSIVNTEIARAETDGRVEQWTEIGLTKKQWAHTGSDTPCPICQANIDLGVVPMGYRYTSVFGEEDVLGPPAHPGVDHCHVKFDEDELISKADQLQLWDGS